MKTQNGMFYFIEIKSLDYDNRGMANNKVQTHLFL